MRTWLGVLIAWLGGCGGGLPTNAGVECLYASDCATGVCLNNRCVPSFDLGLGTSGDLGVAADLTVGPDLAMPPDAATRLLTPVAFAPGVGYGAHTNPVAVAVGKITADDNVDIVVANQTSNDVSVLAGKGDGTFGAPMNTAAGTNPSAVAIADFDSDKKNDLIVTNGDQLVSSPGTTIVLFGNGDGTFKAAPPYAYSGYCNRVVIAEFNGDAHPDVAALCDNGVIVLLGTANGTLSSGPPGYGGFAGTRLFRGLAVGDFNGDGHADLLPGSSPNATGYDVVVLLWQVSNGMFQSAIDTKNNNGYAAVAVGDFDSDGKLDFAGTSQNLVGVSLGKGDGTFNAPVVYPSGSNVRDILVADFNRDGTLDLVTANFNEWTFTVLLGKGDGTFPVAQDFIVAPELASQGAPLAMAFGDFNGDGKPDLVAALPTRVEVLLNATP